jgi:hypothetical protein
VITSTFENVSDIGVCLGLCLGPPANAGVRSKRGAVQGVKDGAGSGYLAEKARLPDPLCSAKFRNIDEHQGDGMAVSA